MMKNKLYNIYLALFVICAGGCLLHAQDLVEQHPYAFLNKMEDVAMHENGTGLAIGSGGLLLGTTNFGEDWTILSQSTYSSRRVEPIPGSNNEGFFIAFSDEIEVSNDAGHSWQNATIPPDLSNSSMNMVSAPTATGLFAGSDDHILKSVDGGLTWTEITPGVTEVDWHSLSFIDDQNGWLSTEDGHIYQTVDGGSSWMAQDTTSFSDKTLVEFMNSQLGFATVFRDLYKTTNGGASWELVLGDAFGSHMAQIEIINEQEITFSQGALVVYATDDGGQTVDRFTALPYGYNYEYMTSLPDGRVWLSCSYGSIAYSENGGFDYVDQLPAIKHFMSDINFINSDIGWTAGRGGMVRTANGGELWEAVTLPLDPEEGEPSNVTMVKPISYSEAIIGADREIRHTVDGGNSWDLLLSSPEDNIFREFAINGDHIWALDNDRQLFHSADNGQSWTDNPLDGSVFSPSFMTFPTPQLGFIGGSSGLLLKTTDAGANWAQVTSFTDVSLKNAFFLDENEGWIIPNVYADYVFHTTDGGENWETVTHGSNSFWNRFYALSSQELYLFGGTSTSGRAMYSNDGGENWESIFTTYVVAYQDVAFESVANGFYIWVCGAAGWIARADFLETGLNTVKATELAIYPNPTSGKVTIDLPEELEAGALYQLIDTQGQLQKQDELDTVLDFSGLPGGIYFLSVRTADETYLAKLIIE